MNYVLSQLASPVIIIIIFSSSFYWMFVHQASTPTLVCKVLSNFISSVAFTIVLFCPCSLSEQWNNVGNKLDPLETPNTYHKCVYS